MANEQNHEIKSFGPQFFIETGSDRMSFCGRTVYFIGAATKLKNVGTGESEVNNNFSFLKLPTICFFPQSCEHIKTSPL